MVCKVRVCEMLFADDCELNESESEMQHNIDLFADDCSRFDLNMLIKPNKVMFQHAPMKPCTDPDIKNQRKDTKYSLTA